MKKIVFAMAVLILGAPTGAFAQGPDDLHVQIHGYATQSLLYTTQNNIFTTNSSDGSAAWTEAVVNLSAKPTDKLRVTIQARYFLLGNYGNAITLDYATGDYKVNERFGVRFGKVKTPIGLFNETQDVDPSYLWALLPQSIYPITSRNSILAHYGGVVYGGIRLGEGFGKLEYRAFGGLGDYAADDGYFVDQAEAGYNLPHGIKGNLYGGAVRWQTPLPGLMVGASDLTARPWSAPYTGEGGLVTGTQTLSGNSQPNYFAIYEKDRVMVAYEYSRNWASALSQFPGVPDSTLRNDDRGWYAMGSYKASKKLTVGAYYSYNSDHEAPLDTGRYSHEEVASGRYDFDEYFYAKGEQHWLQGTGLGYDTDLNPDLQPNTKLTVVRVGVIF